MSRISTSLINTTLVTHAHKVAENCSRVYTDSNYYLALGAEVATYLTKEGWERTQPMFWEHENYPGWNAGTDNGQVTFYYEGHPKLEAPKGTSLPR